MATCWKRTNWSLRVVQESRMTFQESPPSAVFLFMWKSSGGIPRWLETQVMIQASWLERSPLHGGAESVSWFTDMKMLEDALRLRVRQSHRPRDDQFCRPWTRTEKLAPSDVAATQSPVLTPRRPSDMVCPPSLRTTTMSQRLRRLTSALYQRHTDSAWRTRLPYWSNRAVQSDSSVRMNFKSTVSQLLHRWAVYAANKERVSETGWRDTVRCCVHIMTCSYLFSFLMNQC